MGALSWLSNLGFAGSDAGGVAFQACWADDEYTLLFGMKKNVASQIVGVQMITAADGSAFTGTVAVAVTGDGGTQGSGGGTGPTHEGGGCYTYVPTQAETNYNHVCFTFSGTGAISKTVQIYTTFPQTADVGTGTGLTTIPWNAAWDAEVQSEAQDAITASSLATAAAVSTLQTSVDDLPTNAELATALGTADDAVLAQVALVKAKTDSLTFTVANVVDANVQRINDVAIVGDGSGTPFNV